MTAQSSGSTLVRVIACCLTAPSRYMNKGVLCHSWENNVTRSAHGLIIRNMCSEITLVELLPPLTVSTVVTTKLMMTSSNGSISALLALCAGNSPVTGEFPAQRPVTRGFDVFFDLGMNKRLSKQSWGWWFETPSHPLWRHCNVEWLVQIYMAV